MIQFNKNDVVIFSGDSITEGSRGRTMDCNHIMGHGYAYILAARLGADNLSAMPKFMNKGYSGETVSQLYAKWDWDVLQYQPAIVSILVGTNDAEEGERYIPDAGVVHKYIQVYRLLLQDTRKYSPGTKIVVCEPFYRAPNNIDAPYDNVPHPICEPNFPLPGAGSAQEKFAARKQIIQDMQAQLRLLAAEFSCIFVPLQDVFDHAAQTVPGEYLLWDGVHPTVVGHELIAQRWYQQVCQQL